jgi:hypothetical protein
MNRLNPFAVVSLVFAVTVMSGGVARAVSNGTLYGSGYNGLLDETGIAPLDPITGVWRLGGRSWAFGTADR